MRPPLYYDQDFMAQRWSHQRGSTVVISNNTKEYFSWEVIFWNLTFIFSGSHKKFPSVLLQLQTTDNIYLQPFKNVKKNAILFKLFWYKVFVHWKFEIFSL